MLLNTLLILFAYLLGSIASAIIVCKLMGLDDPRLHGSKNPGATNVLRLHGKKAAVITLAGDVLKGVVPVSLAHAVSASELVIALAGITAFIGHLYPVFFKFQGGKGVATLLGVLIGTHWLLGLCFVTTWLIIAVFFRYSSLSALVAALVTPLFTLLILHSHIFAASTGLMAGLLFWRHRSNIRNLMAGTEEKVSIGKQTNQ